MTTTPQHLTILTGASRGMGLAMAQQLLSPNRLLLCISRQENAELAEQAQAARAPLLQWSQDLADTPAARERLRAWLQSLDAAVWQSATLINNAGVIPRIGPLGDCPADELTRALRVGLEAPMQLSAAFLEVTSGWVAAGWRGPRRFTPTPGRHGSCRPSSSGSASRPGALTNTPCAWPSRLPKAISKAHARPFP